MADAIERKITEWLTRLGALTATPTGDNVPAAIKEMAPLLRTVPIQAFSEGSLEHLARACKYFPKYAELRDRLERWWEISAPKAAHALPGAGVPGLDDDDRLWLIAWETREQRESVVATLLDLIRLRSERAYFYLLRTDTQAASIAVSRRWPTDPADVRKVQLAEEWGDREAVQRQVERILAGPADASPPNHAMTSLQMGLLRALVSVHAPQNLDLIPAGPMSGAIDVPAEVEVFRPRQLTPADIEAMRDANPAVKQAREAREARAGDVQQTAIDGELSAVENPRGPFEWS